MSFVVVFLGLLLIGAFIFLSTPASVMARALKTVIPATLMLIGGGLILLRQVGPGSLLLFSGIALWRRMRGVGTLAGPKTGPHRSSVRSAALEMELDHDTGEMNGLVLVGAHEGRVLDDLNQNDLTVLRSEIVDDGESLALLDAYLDRRFAGWRENAEADASTGQAGSPGSGPMGEQEAYEVLGLSAGASPTEIRKAHRRLMKAAHPDSGGSTFLAAKINEAKDVLLRSHS